MELLRAGATYNAHPQKNKLTVTGLSMGERTESRFFSVPLVVREVLGM